jgi:DNA-binding transcriptional regulator YhcF (GntR family)
MLKPLPFQLDRHAPEPLSAQIAAGITRAIGSGYYRVGDRLPNLDDMAVSQGVARQTIRVAIGNLVHQGVVVARRKSGIVVLEPGSSTFTSHVLHLRRGGSTYYFSTRNARLTSRLTGGRVRLSTIDLSPDEYGAGLPQVKAVLEGNRVDLAIIDGQTDVVGDLCRTHNVPYLAVGHERDPGALANLLFDSETPLATLAAHIRKRGVRSLRVVGFTPGIPSILAAFRRAGLEPEPWPVSVKPKKGAGEPQDVEQAGYETLRAHLAHPESLPDLIHFTDDYLARGGLMALVAAGIRVPGQLRVSTLTNRGYRPVFPVSLTRLEIDPVAVGDQVADLVFDLLKSGRKHPDVVVVRAAFVAGESL